MQYAWNMARFLSHEAKQLISCLILKALKQNSPFQARKTWYILCSSKFYAPYVKYASFIKKKLAKVHFLHLVNFTKSVRFTYATTLFQVGEFVKIGFQVLAFLTYRDRAPFFAYLSSVEVSWQEINPFIVTFLHQSTNAFDKRDELK